MISLIPGAVRLKTLEDIYNNMTPATLTVDAKPAVELRRRQRQKAGLLDSQFPIKNVGHPKNSKPTIRPPEFWMDPLDERKLGTDHAGLIEVHTRVAG